MPDANSTALLLVAISASTLLGRQWGEIKRLALARRLRRSLRLAVRRELPREPGYGFQHGRATRPASGPGGEDMAA